MQHRWQHVSLHLTHVCTVWLTLNTAPYVEGHLCFLDSYLIWAKSQQKDLSALVTFQNLEQNEGNYLSLWDEPEEIKMMCHPTEAGTPGHPNKECILSKLKQFFVIHNGQNNGFWDSLNVIHKFWQTTHHGSHFIIPLHRWTGWHFSSTACRAHSALYGMQQDHSE